PLVFLLIFNIMNLVTLRNIYKLKGNNTGINTTFMLFTFATLLFFFVEPVLEGSIFAFTTYCLFQGILKAYLVQYSRISRSRSSTIGKATSHEFI
ncbi:MAG: hypothetical protein AAFO99_11140, partial [Bacteroidota bacterium]